MSPRQVVAVGVNDCRIDIVGGGVGGVEYMSVALLLLARGIGCSTMKNIWCTKATGSQTGLRVCDTLSKSASGVNNNDVNNATSIAYVVIRHLGATTCVMRSKSEVVRLLSYSADSGEEADANCSRMSPSLLWVELGSRCYQL